MLVNIHTYKGYLVITGPKDAHLDWIPAGDGRFGCMLKHAEKHLAISKSALEVLKKLQRPHDDIGDIMWFATPPQGEAFGWIGGSRSIKSIASIESGELTGDRDYQVPGASSYTLIRNNAPKEARKVIDEHQSKTE